MLPELEEYDWEEAFGFAGEPDTCAINYQEGINVQPALPSLSVQNPGGYDLTPFTREDVVEISGISEGENDGRDWVIYGKLKDGRWFLLVAGCDYTGWDCRSWGKAWIGKSKEEIERFAMGQDERERLSIQLPKA